ncbi:MAG: hypothetical protein JWO58_227 [Chitinophagaceae bacterium]|nr:hypothetical protein [Chitinophagaceae bacterium]
MKEHFIRLFNYDREINEQLAQLILDAGSPEKAIQLMAHVLSAQQVWIKRCQQLPVPAQPLWPDWPAERFAALIAQNHTEWSAYLSSLSPADFDVVIHYTTFTGDEFVNRLSDVFAHVINHGTHHRAQIGQQLKLAGLEKLPVTDYILYIRNLEKK